MKKLLFVLALGTFAACGSGSDSSTNGDSSSMTDTSSSMMSAPDTSSSMSMDTMPMSDTTKTDTTMK